MTGPTWYCDEFGTLNLYAGDPCPRLHVWIQPRHPCCDRGHWEWGYAGQILAFPAPPPPSYYFMRLEAAIDEVEAWLAGMAHACPPVELPRPGALPFSQPDGRALGWHWNRALPDTLVARAIAGELHLRRLADPVPHLVLSAHDIAHLDRDDGFPRRYLRARNALAEAEDFLAWRLLGVPAQPRQPLALPPRPVGSHLRRALQSRPHPTPASANHWAMG